MEQAAAEGGDVRDGDDADVAVCIILVCGTVQLHLLFFTLLKRYYLYPFSHRICFEQAVGS